MHKFLNCLLIGFIVGIGWPWVHGLYVNPPPMTLIGAAQTFQAIDRQYALFSLGACALIGAVFGIFLKGKPSASTRAFYLGDTVLDLLICWW